MPTCMTVGNEHVLFMGGGVLQGVSKGGGAVETMLHPVEPGSCGLVSVGRDLFVVTSSRLGWMPLGLEPLSVFDRGPAGIRHVRFDSYAIVRDGDAIFVASADPSRTALSVHALDRAAAKSESDDTYQTIATIRPFSMGSHSLRTFLAAHDGVLYLAIPTFIEETSVWLTRFLRITRWGRVAVELARTASPSVLGIAAAGEFMYWAEGDTGRVLSVKTSSSYVDADEPEAIVHLVPDGPVPSGVRQGGPVGEVSEVCTGLEQLSSLVASGGRLFVANGKELHILPVGGGASRVEPLGDFVATMASDGEALYWVDANRNVWSSTFE